MFDSRRSGCGRVAPAVGRKFLVTAFAALVVAGAGVNASAAGAGGASRFQRATIQRSIKTNRVPLSIDRTPVKVVAVLAGPSVANAQEAAGRRLTRAEKNAIKVQRANEQSGTRGQIEAAGGRVIGSYQSAINGIKLVIPHNQIESLRQIPGVVDVLRVGTFKHENVVSVPRIQAPIAWAGAAGVRGEGVKIAIIDTGIDFMHANFGGPGTVAAYEAAFAADASPADPAFFGPNAPKVKGGTDLVGDDYNADPDSADFQPVPHPDPNPLDCNGHGSHVAGSAAGFGVLANGNKYSGSYDQLTHLNNSFSIGPGVAPRADLYAVRVFGCEGSTDVVIDAIDWAVDNDMDVINMSLGSDFSPGDSADGKAADDATKAGVVVVSAAGNAGNIPYILGSPGGSLKGIAVAANAKEAADRTANFALPATATAAAKTIAGINANDAPLPSPPSLGVVVLRNSNGTVSLGCNPAEYVAANVAGKIAVVQRGTCARVARAVFGQQAGAAAVVMINTDGTLPPFEGPITGNPDTGEVFTVTIPFFGVRGPAATATSDGAALVLRDGVIVALTEGTPIPTGMASFSSTGPRTPDARLKPDITAPGVAIVSTGVGTGNGPATISGTSMATPHIAGTAALVLQAHPKWMPNAVKSAIINSGDPAVISDYQTRRAGTGMVNAAGAAGTLAYAFADADETTANFGLEEFATDLSRNRTIKVKNDAASAVTFNVTVERKAGSAHSVTLSSSQVTVGARSTASVDMTLTLPAATAGPSNTFRDVAGLIKFTPTGTGNRGFSLRVPYYLVPRVSANVDAALALPKKSTTGIVALTNAKSAIGADADFYAWGLESKRAGLGRFDLHAAGVQSFPDSSGDALLVFAVNTFKGWSTPEQEEFDVDIDTNGDGTPDFVVFNADLGQLQQIGFNGQIVAAIFNLATGELSVDFLAAAPTDSSTILLPVLASSLGITTTAPRFNYTATAFDLLSDAQDSFDEVASFNAFQSAITTGQFETVAPNATVGVPFAIDAAEAKITPPKGYLIVTPDNKNGANEVNLLRIKF